MTALDILAFALRAVGGQRKLPLMRTGGGRGGLHQRREASEIGAGGL